MRELPAADLQHVVEHAGGALRELKGADVFITGATGFVGSWMLETFLHANTALDLGAKATVLVRDGNAWRERFPHLAKSPRIELHVGDVRTIDPPRGAFTHVLHCASAAPPKVNVERPDEVVDLIVRGTQRMVDAAVESKAKGFLMISSGSVYGPQPPELKRIPEDYPGTASGTDAAQRFGAAKRRAERVCAARAKEIGFVSARVFALVGPRLPLDGQFALGQFLGDALAGREIDVTGDGTPVRTYMHAADLAAWCWTMLARAEPGSVYNVGSEEEHTIWDVAQRVAKLPSPPVQVVRAAEPSAVTPTSRYVPSTERARFQLSLDAWIGLDDALARTWAWLRQGVA